MSKLPWSTSSPRAPHVRSFARQTGNPSGAILSPRQFRQKGTVNFRHSYSLGASAVTVSKKGFSVSTHQGHGLPSTSTGRRGTRSSMKMGMGYTYRRTTPRKFG